MGTTQIHDRDRLLKIYERQDQVRSAQRSLDSFSTEIKAKVSARHRLLEKEFHRLDQEKQAEVNQLFDEPEEHHTEIDSLLIAPTEGL